MSIAHLETGHCDNNPFTVRWDRQRDGIRRRIATAILAERCRFDPLPLASIDQFFPIRFSCHMIESGPPTMQEALMRKAIFAVAIIGLAGCEQPTEIKLPFDNSTGFLDGHQLRVPKNPPFTWSSAPIDEETLERHLQQIARRPNGGRVFVEFEPGVSKQRKNFIRQKIIDSGLCEQRRCAEVGWNVERPVVN